MSRFFGFFNDRPKGVTTERSQQARELPPLTKEDFVRQRGEPRKLDKVLSDLAHRWLDQLPARVRPLKLSEQYPRITNRLALCWNDAKLTEHLFAELMLDRRGGRGGFAPPVATELLALREWFDGHVDAVDTSWELHSLAPKDR